MRMFSSLIAVSTIGVLLSPGEIDASGDGPSPGDMFSDCDNCPEMIVIPAGRFAMGASETDGERQARESPQHEVTIPEPFAVGKFEVTRGQFADFVADRGWKTQDACGTYENEGWDLRPGRTWRDPGFPQDATHPVNCVTFDDARGYVAWLSEKTGHDYRLLSEAEWEYAARGGATTPFFFGEEEAALCQNANGADKSAQALSPTWTWANSCDDGHPFTAPVGTYRPNAFGLHDMTGNVWEWVSDCFHESYDGAPDDGSSWETPDCPLRVSRGGGLFDSPSVLRLTFRGKGTPDSLDFESGFRVARTIDQEP
jgi:formylglycine-generating enzyme required for sulfatase activity